MKHTFLRSLIIGACCTAPLAAIAGGIDVVAPPTPPRVTIPDMPAGWGLSVEGSALRGYNNDLTYFFTESNKVINNTTETNNQFSPVNPDYAFDLRVGVDYTLEGAANRLKLYYEHLFNRTAESELNTTIADPTYPTTGSQYIINAEASLQLKFDGVSLVSEQHILIGPIWETTITGGARFAHLSQRLNVNNTENITQHSLITLQNAYQNFETQFNGVGPLAGLGTIFNIGGNFALGAEAQGALLIGQNKISTSFIETQFNETSRLFTESQILTNVDHIYSTVPELYYRLYANYFYQFNNGSELQIEAGWRANQFFNVRTFDQIANSNSGGAFLAAISGTETVAISVNSTKSDDIGFSGPYLMLHYKL